MAGKLIDRRRFLSLFIATGTALAVPDLLAACLGTTSTAPTGKYQVGLLATVSGIFSQFGDLMVKSAQLAVDTINSSGGIGGHTVSLVIEDTASDAGNTAERARKMLQLDRVDALIGTVGTPETLAVIPLVQDAKKLFFYPVGGGWKACEPSTKKLVPYIFAMGDTPEQHFQTATPIMAEKFGKKWYFLEQDYDFGRGAARTCRSFLEAAGGQVIKEEFAAFGTPDYAPFIDRIQRSNADVVFSTVVGTDGVAFVKAAANAGLLQQRVLTGWGPFSAEVQSGIKGLANGVVLNTFYSEQLDNSANKKLVNDYNNRFHAGLPVAPTAAAVYSSFLLLQEAAKRANSVKAEDLIHVLEGLSVDLPQGHVRVNPDNHTLDAHQYLLKIENDQYKIVDDLGIQIHPDHVGCAES